MFGQIVALPYFSNISFIYFTLRGVYRINLTINFTHIQYLQFAASNQFVLFSAIKNFFFLAKLDSGEHSVGGILELLYTDSRKHSWWIL